MEVLAALDVDVSYVLTGHRAHMQAAPVDSLRRSLTPEEAALLDNYKAADEQGRATARSVLDALAKQKAA